MGLFFTLLYITAAYLGPQTVFGVLAEYRIQFVVAIMAMLSSIPNMPRARIFGIPQTFALFGMCVAVFVSILATGWFGGAPSITLDFIPNAFTFFFVVINCRKKRHLVMVICVILFASLFTIYRGNNALEANNFASPYLVTQGNDSGVVFARLRGLSFISDPNDFAQLCVSLIPCLFFFWKPNVLPRNIFFVLIPSGLLIFGMYLTHSRGGMIALIAMIMFAARRKIGTIPAVISAGVIFAITSAIGWSGGREVSVEAGSGRMEAWAVGLDLIKQHPLFGVGYQGFGEYFDITAHNTIVVCAAELGMFGLFFWVMFVLPTLRDSYVTSIPPKDEAKEAELRNAADPNAGFLAARESAALTQYPSRGTATAVALQNEVETIVDHSYANPNFADSLVEDIEKTPEDEIRRLGRLMLLSLTGYFVAGWFLSRAYVMTLFIYGGMVQVIYDMALSQGLVPPRMATSRIMRLSAIWSVGLIIIVYIMLRIQHLLPA